MLDAKAVHQVAHLFDDALNRVPAYLVPPESGRGAKGAAVGAAPARQKGSSPHLAPSHGRQRHPAKVFGMNQGTIRDRNPIQRLDERAGRRQDRLSILTPDKPGYVPYGLGTQVTMLLKSL